MPLNRRLLLFKYILYENGHSIKERHDLDSKIQDS